MHETNPKQNMKNVVDPGTIIFVKSDQNWTSLINQKESDNDATYSGSKGDFCRYLDVFLKSLSCIVAFWFVIPVSIFYKIEKLFKDLLNRNQTAMCSDDDDLPNPDDVTIFEDSDRFWPHGDISDQDVENYRRNLRETVKNWIINDDETGERHLKEELFRIGKYEDKNRLIALLEEMQNHDGKKIVLTLFLL